jgi:hypothetical protein
MRRSTLCALSVLTTLSAALGGCAVPDRDLFGAAGTEAPAERVPVTPSPDPATGATSLDASARNRGRPPATHRDTDRERAGKDDPGRPTEPSPAGGGDTAGGEPAICPAGARYREHAGRGYCLFEALALPQAPGLEPYCHWIDLGYIGFDWPFMDESAAPYACPPGSWRSTNEVDHDFCIFPVPTVEGQPLEAFCKTLDLGVIGYSFKLPGSQNETPLCE